jgi:flagellar hook-basal body complex protein FliE
MTNKLPGKRDAFESGDANVSLAEVMVASQKASVSFQAMLQVRNKLVEAYKDVMNMPM